MVMVWTPTSYGPWPITSNSGSDASVVAGAASVVGASVSTGASVVAEATSVVGDAVSVSVVALSSLPQAAIPRAETRVRASREERTAAT